MNRNLRFEMLEIAHCNLNPLSSLVHSPTWPIYSLWEALSFAIPRNVLQIPASIQHCYWAWHLVGQTQFYPVHVLDKEGVKACDAANVFSPKGFEKSDGLATCLHTFTFLVRTMCASCIFIWNKCLAVCLVGASWHKTACKGSSSASSSILRYLAIN